MLFVYYQSGGVYLTIGPGNSPNLQIELTGEELRRLDNEDWGHYRQILEKVAQSAFKLGQQFPDAEVKT